MVNRAVSLAMLWARCAWRPTPDVLRTRLRSLLGYSSAILGSHLLSSFPETLQNLMVGRLARTRRWVV